MRNLDMFGDKLNFVAQKLRELIKILVLNFDPALDYVLMALVVINLVPEACSTWQPSANSKVD